MSRYKVIWGVLIHEVFLNLFMNRDFAVSNFYKIVKSVFSSRSRIQNNAGCCWTCFICVHFILRLLVNHDDIWMQCKLHNTALDEDKKKILLAKKNQQTSSIRKTTRRNIGLLAILFTFMCNLLEKYEKSFVLLPFYVC